MVFFPELFDLFFTVNKIQIRIYLLIQSKLLLFLIVMKAVDRSVLRTLALLPVFAIRPVVLLAHTGQPVQCLCICVSELTQMYIRCPGLS